MRYGIAVWNYAEPGVAAAELVQSLADIGFDSMALQLHVLGRLNGSELAEVAEVVRRRDLVVTLHTNFPLFRLGDLQTVLAALGERLATVTFDASKTTTSSGTFFDLEEMAPTLQAIAADAPQLKFGVEDFPLDEEALEYYRPALHPFLDNPNFGMLLDLGHLNLRQRSHRYFQQSGTAEQVKQVPVPILEVHVHDNDGQKDLHQHLGVGNTDFAGAAQGLREAGFDGICTIEVSPGMHEESISASRPLLPRSLELWRGLMEDQK